MDLEALLDSTLKGLGYELVDVEMGGRGKLLRIFIDKPGGVAIDDCAFVSNHLTRLLAVENFDYERLEVSSPGLDRPLKKEADFRRFSGEKAHIRLRMPREGKRNFVGILRNIENGVLQLEVDGMPLSVDLADVDRARLVPRF